MLVTSLRERPSAVSQAKEGQECRATWADESLAVHRSLSVKIEKNTSTLLVPESEHQIKSLQLRTKREYGYMLQAYGSYKHRCQV